MVNAAPEQPGFIQRIIAASARNPFLTIFTVAALTLWGYYCVRHIPLDAVPDLSDTQVILFTEWPGRSPDLVEDQITYPLSTTLPATTCFSITVPVTGDRIGIYSAGFPVSARRVI